MRSSPACVDELSGLGLGAVGGASTLALTGVLCLAAVVSGLAATFAFAGVLAFTCVLLGLRIIEAQRGREAKGAADAAGGTRVGGGGGCERGGGAGQQSGHGGGHQQRLHGGFGHWDVPFENRFGLMDGTGRSNPDCLATLMGLEGERKSYSGVENVFQYLFSPWCNFMPQYGVSLIQR